MQCIKCSTDNEAGLKFCKACGSKLPAPAEPAPEPVSAVPTSMPESVCPQCGHINAPAARFCAKCGTRLGAAAAVAAPPPPFQQMPPGDDTFFAPAAVPGTAPVVSSSFDPLAAFPATSLPPPSPAAPPASAPAPIPANAAANASGNRNGLLIGGIVLIAAVLAGGSIWVLSQRSGAQPPAVAANVPPPPVNTAPKELYEPKPEPAPTPAPVDTGKTVEPPLQPAQAPADPVPPAVAAQPAETPAAVTAPAPAARPQPRPAPKPVEPMVRPVTPPVVTPAPPPVIAAAPAAPAPDDWYASLRAELARCETKGNFFAKELCRDRARRQWCEPGARWGKVPECARPRRPEEQ